MGDGVTGLDGRGAIGRRGIRYQPAKRALDVLFALALAPLWVPATLLAALAVRIAMGSPSFFRQTRTGRGGRPFVILKIRTMRDGGGPEEGRITGIGRILRKTGLDELPQMANVLRGEMSFVGPRPLLPEYLPLYSPEEARRHDVAPGITGLAQVNGRNATTWRERLALDVEYVDRQSPWLDAAIVAKTIFLAATSPFVRRRSDERVMPPFTGHPDA